VLKDVILDVAEALDGGGVVGVDKGAPAERRLELGAAAHQLLPHPFHLLLRLGAALRPGAEEARHLQDGGGGRADLAAAATQLRDRRLEGRYGACFLGRGRTDESVACGCFLQLMRARSLHGSAYLACCRYAHRQKACYIASLCSRSSLHDTRTRENFEFEFPNIYLIIPQIPLEPRSIIYNDSRGRMQSK
jgi:hypothetical protein